ncbi:MAG: hypothetical protein U0526_02375 [Candidatus Saccharibacteria bacterium]|jgi:hypothetical protein
MQFGSLSIDANLYVFAIIGGFFLMAFLFGEGRLKRIAAAVLVGLFAVDQLSELVVTQLDKLGLKTLELATVQLALLAVVAITLSLGKTVSVGGRFGLRSFILAFLTSATLIAYTQSYLKPEVGSKVLENYNLVALAANNRLYLLAATITWLIIITVWKRKIKDDDDAKGKKGKKGKKKK